VATRKLMTRAHRQRRRSAIALVVSALAHVTVLGLLTRYVPVFRPLAVAPRDFEIELVPTAPLAQPLGEAKQSGASPETAAAATPRTAKTTRRHTDLQTTTPYPLPKPGPAAQAPRPPSLLAKPTPPAPPPPARINLPGAEPSGAVAGAPGAAGGLRGFPDGSQNEGEAEGAGVRGALRTSVGCDDPDYYNLSKAERAACQRAYGVQAAIGRRQYVDAIGSGKVRNEFDRAREACERLNHYATPLDSDREHSASAPVGKLRDILNNTKLRC
jgi:hypothetical protein